MLSTTAPFTLSDDEQVIAALLVQSVQGERKHSGNKGAHTLALLQSLQAIDAAGHLTASGDALNDSALARAIVPAGWTDAEGKAITFVWASAQSKAGKATLAAGKDAPEGSQEAAYARYLLDCGAVQVAITAAKKTAKAARDGKPANVVTRGAGKAATEKDGGKPADVPATDAPAATGQATLPGAPVVTVTTTPAVGKVSTVDPVASILAMDDAAAHAAIGRLLAAMTARGYAGRVIAEAEAYVAAHKAIGAAAAAAAHGTPAKATPATTRKRATPSKAAKDLEAIARPVVLK